MTISFSRRIMLHDAGWFLSSNVLPVKLRSYVQFAISFTNFYLLFSCFQRLFPKDKASGVPRNFVQGGGGSTISVEERGQRERGSGGGSPLVRGSGGSCNLVQEISFHIVKFS
jgi:hypothetical protein